MRSVWALLTLQRRLAWSEPRLRRWQEERLRMLLAWAVQHVPFHAERLGGLHVDRFGGLADLGRLPITEREAVRAAGTALLVRGVHPERCVRVLTSGSTGIPITLHFSRSEEAIRKALSKRAFLALGIPPWRYRLVFGNPRPLRRTIYQRMGIYPEGRVSAFEPLEAQVRRYREERPAIVSGYPSSLALLAEGLRADGGPIPRPRLVLTGGEMLYPSMRECFESTFDAPVSQLYGVEEMGHVAWECRTGGGLHFAADCGVFEVVDGDTPVPPGVEGDLLVTSLFGRTMPLIRYRIGDRVVIDPDPCPCGCPFPRFRRIVGRSDDLLRMPDGRFVHPVVAACGVVDARGVRRFRIVQKTDGAMRVELDCRDPVSDSLRASISAHFESHLGARDVEVVRVAAIPSDASGKLRHIVRDVDDGSAAHVIAADDAPVLVVGMPRSGTTLVSALLASHPRIAIAPETHYLSTWMHRAPDLPRGFGEFWPAFARSPQFALLGLDAAEIEQRLRDGDACDHATIFATLLRAYAAARGKARWGEKTPTHYLYVDRLLRWFPGARILFVVRDPRAVVASRLRMPWKRRGVADVAAQWRDCARRLERRTTDRRVAHVRFEDLVAAPAHALRSVCAHIGEEFAASMLDHGGAAANLSAGQPWNRGVGEAIDASRADRWERELPPRDAQVVEHLARDEMLRFGYEPRSPRLSRVRASSIHLRRAWRAAGRRMRPGATL